MKNETSIRWSAWYGDVDLPLAFPSTWEVQTYPPRGKTGLNETALRAALEHPIGSPPLKEFASGKRRAAIVVDDLTRPTPARRVLPLILETLAAAGVDQEDIQIIIGVGAHHSMRKKAIEKKIGPEIAGRYRVVNHDPEGDCEYLGTTSLGTPIHINRDFLRADMKICVGSVLPHTGAGFGGGAKLVFPGVAAMEAIYHNHRTDSGLEGGINRIRGNTFRRDFEEGAEMAGLDFSVNAVLNADREIAGLFCGHYVAAHRKAVDLARRVYHTPAPDGCDVVVLSAYPKDSEFYQCTQAENVLISALKNVLKHNGIPVICTAATEGMGENRLTGSGHRMGKDVFLRNRKRQGRKLYFSPNVWPGDLDRWGLNGRALHRNWDDLAARLLDRIGRRARVAVFPCASMQLGADG